MPLASKYKTGDIKTIGIMKKCGSPKKSRKPLNINLKGNIMTNSDNNK